MRALGLVLLLCGCSKVVAPSDELARRVCTSEGMWCQDADHSRCCRALKCVDSVCVKRPAPDKGDREQL